MTETITEPETERLIAAMVREGWTGPLSEDDRMIIEERAAIKEFDAGMTRHQAEEAAALEYLQGVSE